MIIKKKLLFEGSKNEADLYALFDSGATYSCISPEYADKLAHSEKIRRPFKVETAYKGHLIEVTLEYFDTQEERYRSLLFFFVIVTISRFTIDK